MLENTGNIKLDPQNNYNLTSALRNKTHIFTGFNKTGEIPSLLFSCKISWLIWFAGLKDSY